MFGCWKNHNTKPRRANPLKFGRQALPLFINYEVEDCKEAIHDCREKYLYQPLFKAEVIDSTNLTHTLPLSPIFKSTSVFSGELTA